MSDTPRKPRAPRGSHAPRASDSLREIAREIVACRACPRLVEHRERVARVKRRAYADQPYWGRPVPGFGVARARVVLVGLAPGAHGANRTGRIFTGDSSGDFLYPALHRCGLASQPDATGRKDGMRLVDCFITCAARCAPPDNKPSREEFDTCRPFLERELRCLTRARVYVALGRHGFDALLRVLPALGYAHAPEARDGRGSSAPAHGTSRTPATRRSARRAPRPAFGHDVAHVFHPTDSRRTPRVVLCSYHPSQQNTQTGRLTTAMFDRVFRRARALVEDPESWPRANHRPRRPR